MTREEYFNTFDTNCETWKDIDGYKGIYQVSNLGRVRSLDRINSYGERARGVMKTPSNNGHGYLFVCLCKNGQTKRFYIHRLVGMMFIPNPPKLPQINHKNEIKSDNRVENLEWCTQQYNNNYGTKKARARETFEKGNFSRPIDVYSKDGKFIKTYLCAYDMEKDGISRRAAYSICDGRVLSWHGLTFRYSGETYKPRKELNPTHSPCNIYKYDLDDNLLKVYHSTVSAERDNGLNRNFLYSASFRHTRVVVLKDCKLSYFPINKDK